MRSANARQNLLKPSLINVEWKKLMNKFSYTIEFSTLQCKIQYCHKISQILIQRETLYNFTSFVLVSAAMNYSKTVHFLRFDCTILLLECLIHLKYPSNLSHTDCYTVSVHTYVITTASSNTTEQKGESKRMRQTDSNCSRMLKLVNALE